MLVLCFLFLKKQQKTMMMSRMRRRRIKPTGIPTARPSFQFSTPGFGMPEKYYWESLNVSYCLFINLILFPFSKIRLGTNSLACWKILWEMLPDWDNLDILQTPLCHCKCSQGISNKHCSFENSLLDKQLKFNEL